MDRFASRLTVADLATITARVSEVYAAWRQSGVPRLSTDPDMLVRLGAWSIGCWICDLRSVELAAIRQIVGAL